METCYFLLVISVATDVIAGCVVWLQL